VGQVLTLRTSIAQRALARFRAEERAFGVVLDVLREWRHEDLLVRMSALYRKRMRCLRKIAGSLLDSDASPSAVEELRRFSRERTP
jgi:hypothetical protein